MYRRNHTPSNRTSRASSYLQALERDEMVSNLRRQYALYKTLESEYDDVRYQIGKAERETQKMQDKNAQVQEEYLEQIKGNKSIITELTYQIESAKSELDNLVDEISKKERKNENLIQQIKKTKGKVENENLETQTFEEHLCNQEKIITDLKGSLLQLEMRKRQIQDSNKLRSSQVDSKVGNCQQIEERIKLEEINKMDLDKEVQLLKEKKRKLAEKSQKNQYKMGQLSKKHNLCEYENEKFVNKTGQLEKQMNRVFSDSINLKNKMKKSIAGNKEKSQRLKSMESILQENVDNLYTSKLKKEELLVELANLMKFIEKTENTIEILEKEILQSDHNNHGLLTNLKKSIQNDEEAVKTLTRKTAILNLISQ